MFLQDVPLVSATTAHAWAGTTVAHDTDANYGDFLRPGTDTGKWIDGNSLLGRKGLVVLNIGTVAAGATDFKLCLLEATDADGGSGASKSVIVEMANAALGTGEKAYVYELSFDSTVIDTTKFYALAGASKGGTPATDGVPFSATLLFLDPTYVG